MRESILIVVLASFTLGLNGIAPIHAASMPETRPDFSNGYIKPDNLPNSLELLPQPPAEDPTSAAWLRDLVINRGSILLRDTPRWRLARQDAEIRFPQLLDTFSCALNSRITENDAPHIFKVLFKARGDAATATAKAKNKYKRTRPFVENNEPTCKPEDNEFLKTNFSYPSGHSSVGWAWALILSEIDPDHIDAILARGLAFGDSRVVCNVHWESDVEEGRVIAAGVVARLHGDAEFLKDLKKAKEEFVEMRKKGIKPARDCAAEAAAMSMRP